MDDMSARNTHAEPTDEELAAALAAVRLLLQQRAESMGATSRWLRTGRIESVSPTPRPAGWATAERPR